jgi:DNA-binding transcriptional MerR regulator
VESTFTINEVSATTGLSVHTLRYYERAGLLLSVPRNAGGHRRYSRMDVDALNFVTRLRQTGMPIHRVREYVALARQGRPTVEARRKLLEEHRKSICQEIQALEQNLAIVDYKIDLYHRNWHPSGPDDACLGHLRTLYQSGRNAPEVQIEKPIKS